MILVLCAGLVISLLFLIFTRDNVSIGGVRADIDDKTSTLRLCPLDAVYDSEAYQECGEEVWQAPGQDPDDRSMTERRPQVILVERHEQEQHGKQEYVGSDNPCSCFPVHDNPI